MKHCIASALRCEKILLGSTFTMSKDSLGKSHAIFQITFTWMSMLIILILYINVYVFNISSVPIYENLGSMACRSCLLDTAPK